VPILAHRTVTGLSPHRRDARSYREDMLNEHEAHRQHVLTLIENAQRAGRSEPEIVAIVERFFNTEKVKPHKPSLLARLRKAA
jgi:hypothetical protein